MRVSRRLLPGALLFSCAIWGCHPFDPFQGEFNAGPIDPFNFAPPYRTTNGVGNNQLASFPTSGSCSRVVAGSCSIVEARAYIDGTASGNGYFRFPFSPSQITTWQYPPVATLTPRVTGSGAVPTPNAYVFDGSVSPAGDSTSCTPPNGYSYNPFRDDLHYDQQGNIFAALPNATWSEGSNPTWTYVPVVARVPVTSQGEHCQAIKSEQTVLTRSDVSVQRGPDRPDGTPTGVPDGTYLAWAIIDPGSPVLKWNEPSNSSGLAHQRYGWYNQYFVAYLDGGLIPVAGGEMRTQKVFYPRTNVLFSCTSNSDCSKFPGSGMAASCENPGPTGLCRTATQCPALPTTCAQAVGDGSDCDMSVTPNLCRQPINVGLPGRLSQGYDVLQFQRTDASYSPVCLVQSYAMPTTVTRTSELPHDAATITGGAFQVDGPPNPGTPGGVITPTYIFCLQVP